MKLSRNFTLEELTGTTHKELLADNIYYAMNNFDKLQELAYFAQDIRDLLGVPMTITSAVRCPQLNTKIGGSVNSQHQKIEAIDFIPAKIKLKDAFLKIKNSDIQFGQLIIEKSGDKEWLHISIGTKREVLKYDGKRYTILQ